jgi:hyaluronoglucosaminidase
MSRLRALGLALLVAFVSLGLGNGPTSRSGSADSPFAWRGVIQGQYGHEFSAAERIRLLRFMARNGFNAYVHAPKENPYQRLLWDQQYPAGAQAEFDREVQLASRLGIEWIPNVSPGAAAYSSPGEAVPPGLSRSRPICFSSADDLGRLLAKLEPFRAAGVDTFMVSFDDIEWTFSCQADVAACGAGEAAFGRANADLLNRLRAALLDRDPSARLLTVTPEYDGTQDGEYLRGFRQVLGPGVEVMWTGAATESRPFSPAEADVYAGLIGRAPIVWENWTTNDALNFGGDWPARVFLGPYARRPDVAGHVGGFFFNPANQSELNYLPLATAAKWLRNPVRYRPRRAFLYETRRLAGREAPALRAFAEASYSSSLQRAVEAPTLRRLIRGLLRAEGDRAARAARRLRSHLRLAASARRHLIRVRGLREFVHQARPFLRSARINARAGLIATDLLRAGAPAERRRLRHRLRRALRRAESWPAETFGTRIGVYGLAGNVIDGYAERALRRDRHRPRHPHRPPVR